MNFTPVKNLTREENKTISDARLGVTLCSPLLSYMLLKTKTFITEDVMKYNTACAGYCPKTEKFYIAIHREFWNSLPNNEQRTFVIIHEVLHVFLNHAMRCREMNYNANIWNKATDYYINLMGMGYIKRNGVITQTMRYKKYVEIPEWVLFKKQYFGMSAPEIYQELMKNETSEFDDESDGNGEAGGQRPLDSVSDFDIKSSAEMDAKCKEVLHGAITFSNSSNIGEESGEFLEDIKDIIDVKIDWKDKLTIEISHLGNDDITYNRISRRGDGSVIYPRYESEHISLVFGFDSSGSMSSDDYMEVSGALQSILDQYESWDIIVLSCDTRAKVIGRFNSEEDADFSYMDLTAHGLSGTDLTPIVKYTNQLISDGEEINGLIIVTDGHIPTRVDEYFDSNLSNYVVVTKNGNKSLKLSACDIIHVN